MLVAGFNVNKEGVGISQNKKEYCCTCPLISCGKVVKKISNESKIS